MRLAFTLAAVAALTVGSAAGAQTVTNGSFETGPAVGNGGFATLGTGDTSITGWTVTSGTVDYLNNYFPAQDGTHSVDLSGNGPGTLSQVISGLTAGNAYNVSFFLGGNFEGPPPAKTLNVSAGAATQGFTYTGPAGGFSGYTRYNFRFTALAPTTTLSFASTTGTPYGPVLDNVAIAAVPEPASWALMIGGFGLVGYAMRRRRKLTGTAFA